MISVINSQLQNAFIFLYVSRIQKFSETAAFFSLPLDSEMKIGMWLLQLLSVQHSISHCFKFQL